MDPGAGGGRRQTPGVGRSALSPFRRGIDFLKEPGIRHIPDDRQRTNGLLEVVGELVVHVHGLERLGQSYYGNREDYTDDEYRTHGSNPFLCTIGPPGETAPAQCVNL